MSLKNSFLDALVSLPKLPASFKAEDFLGQYLAPEKEPSTPLFHILSGGRLKTVFPWSFDLKSLDCFLLLYTTGGCGKLLIDNQSHSLSGETLLFLDCRERFRLDIATAPWEYQFLFIDGSMLDYYAGLLNGQRFSLMPLSPYSDTALKLEDLFSLTYSGSTRQKLSVSACLNQIVTDCVMAVVDADLEAVSIPSYIQDLKVLFDNHFDELYSLNELETHYGVSKYRLCREFKAAYQIPPLQYLNRRRIEIAGHLLVASGLRIHEIGSRVGIDNTNHFINLFKKYEGCTPLEYRQRMTR